MKILYDKLNKDRVLLNTEVTKVDDKERIVTTNSGEEYKYEYLINTIPLNCFLPLFENDEYKKICDELSGLTETQVYLDWVVTLFLKQRGKSNLIEFPVTLTGIYGHTCFSEPSQSTTK